MTLKDKLFSIDNRIINSIAVLLYGFPYKEKISYYNECGEKNIQLMRDVISNKYAYYRSFIEYGKNKILIHQKEGGMQEVASFPNLKVKHAHKTSLVIIEEGAIFYNLIIETGDSNIFVVNKSKTPFHNLSIIAPRNTNGLCYIGKDFLCYKLVLRMGEDKSIYIGDDVLVSQDTYMWNGDGHAIFNLDKNCINHGDDIFIGNHCWIGHAVEILKGTFINDNCVIGARSVVSKKFHEKNCIIAGHPAKIVKRQINWDHKSPAFFN